MFNPINSKFACCKFFCDLLLSFDFFRKNLAGGLFVLGPLCSENVLFNIFFMLEVTCHLLIIFVNSFAPDQD